MSAVSTARKKPKTRSEELRRIPGNPKYQNVKALVDSGTNVQKYLEKMKESHKNQKQNEIYKRIRLSSFVALMIQAAKEKMHSLEAGDKRDTGKDNVSKEMPIRARSSLSSVISGIGELDIKNGRDFDIPCPSTMFQNQSASCPYLLLDVRDVDDYRNNHILTARSYPTALLCRTCNYETPELLQYKNREGKIIVLYDYDETLACRAATTLVQRGYDNIYLLTGGLKLAAEKFAAGFVTGKLPDRETIVEDKDTLTNNDVTILQVQLDRFLMASSGPTQFRAFRTPSTVSKTPAWR